MLSLSMLREEIAQKRKALGLSQTALAKKAPVGRSTWMLSKMAAWESWDTQRSTTFFPRWGLELRIQEAISRRPTLEELMSEVSRD